MADIWWKPSQSSIKMMLAAVVETFLVGLFAFPPTRFTVSGQFVQLSVQLPIRGHPPQGFPEVNEEVQDDSSGNHR